MDPHQEMLLKAAARLGVDVQAQAEEDEITYRAGGRSARVFRGRRYPELTPNLAALCDDKAGMKEVLASCRVPTPSGVVVPQGATHTAVHRAAQALVEEAAPEGSRFVAKPLHGSNGEGVSIDLPTAEELTQAALRLVSRGPALLEEHAVGLDLRLQVIGGEVAAACARIPATVVGDGAQTIRQLMAARDRVVQGQNPQNRLLVCGQTRRLLGEAGLGLDDIPAEGEPVQVKLVANMSQGARAVDVTDILHPDYALWTAFVAAALPLETFGFDFITSDPSEEPGASGAVALEINAESQWLHHTFSEGRRHDIPNRILSWLLGL